MQPCGCADRVRDDGRNAFDAYWKREGATAPPRGMSKTTAVLPLMLAGSSRRDRANDVSGPY